MIAFVLGTRPEVTKLAPIMNRIPEARRLVLWTGQHYTGSLIQSLWNDVGFKGPIEGIQPFSSTPLYSEDAGFGSNDARALSYMLHALTGMLRAPHLSVQCVVVLGDTTSALAGAIAGAKLGIRVLHVESGCRSWDMSQPEELNRKLIDHASTDHACSYKCDGLNLCDEGIINGVWTGDPGIESIMDWKNEVGDLQRFDSIIATIHRAETLTNPEKLKGVMDFLSDIAIDTTLTIFAHPHLMKCLEDARFKPWSSNITMLDPLHPNEFRKTLAQCGAVVTDSGGVTAEAAWLGTPCLLARDFTEYHDLVAEGRIVLGGRTRDSLHEAWSSLPVDLPPGSERLERAWDGKASERILEVLDS